MARLGIMGSSTQRPGPLRKKWPTVKDSLRNCPGRQENLLPCSVVSMKALKMKLAHKKTPASFHWSGFLHLTLARTPPAANAAVARPLDVDLASLGGTRLAPGRLV
jgi:hypothetical protein